MTGRSRWSDDVVARATLLYGRGYGYLAVAQALADEMPEAPSWHTVRDWCSGRSRVDATTRARGWTWQRWTAAEDAQVLAPDRPTLAVLATRLGRTPGAVALRRHQLRHGRVPRRGGVG